ncbi:hypothetical protein [Sphaerisporangium aureirubrum]|uniref:Uncharacterized protein n=1 Tax=Sphaerisporangium aureirubrum TaxID=1544736 RepID=A0ABW1NFZ2_9ACTN
MTVPHAILAYGYDLGGGGEWKITQKDEYGTPAVPWYDSDRDDFIDQATTVLLADAGLADPSPWNQGEDLKYHLGVKFERYAEWDNPVYVLAAHVINRDWEDTELLDMQALTQQVRDQGWDDKLRHAVETLGITPEQTGPGWILGAYQS